MPGMGRTVSAGVLVRDQLDIYNPPSSFTRSTGVVPSGISVTAFVNNAAVAWPLADGTAVADSSVSAGTVYFNEIPGSAGFYSLKFFPDRVGFWRFVIRIAATSTEVVKEYDVVPSQQVNASSGLNASFLR